MKTDRQPSEREMDQWYLRRFGVPGSIMHKAGNFVLGIAGGLVLPWLLPPMPALRFGISFGCVVYCAMNAWDLTNRAALTQLWQGMRTHRAAWATYSVMLALLGAGAITLVAWVLNSVVRMTA